MARKFLISLVAFITVFFLQAQVWAASQNVEKVTQNQVQTYTIDTSSFLTDEEPIQLSRRMAVGGEAAQWLWVASAFIPGLGQLLMGDLWRGIKWFIIVAIAPILVGIVSAVLTAVLGATGLAGLAGIIGIVALVANLVALGLYLWNRHRLGRACLNLVFEWSRWTSV